MRPTHFVFITIILILGCSEEEKSCEPHIVRPIATLNYDQRRRIQVDGDQKSYREFLTENAFNYPQNVLFYSLIMAHEFKSPAAYYDVYILTRLAIDKAGVGSKYKNIMSEFALPYLYESAKLGFEQAQQTILHLDSTSASSPAAQ